MGSGPGCAVRSCHQSHGLRSGQDLFPVRIDGKISVIVNCQYGTLDPGSAEGAALQGFKVTLADLYAAEDQPVFTVHHNSLRQRIHLYGVDFFIREITLRSHGLLDIISLSRQDLDLVGTAVRADQKGACRGTFLFGVLLGIVKRIDCPEDGECIGCLLFLFLRGMFSDNDLALAGRFL